MQLIGTAPLLLILLSCAHVKITDSEWTGSLGVQGGTSFHTLTDEEHDLNFQQIIDKWCDLEHPQVMTSVDTLTNWKGIIEKLCSDSNKCTYDQQVTQSGLLNFLENIETLNVQE